MADAQTQGAAFDLSAGTPSPSGELRPTPKYADRISKRVLLVVFGVALLMLAIFFAALESMDSKPQSDTSTTKQGSEGKRPTASDTEVGAPKELTASPQETDAVGKKAPTPASLIQAPGSALSSKGAAQQPDALGIDPVTGLHTSIKPTVKDVDSAQPGAKGTGVPGIGNRGAGGGQGGSSLHDPGDTYGDAGGSSSQPPKLTPEEQAANMAKTSRLARMQDARTKGPSARSFNTDETGAGAAATPAANALKELLAQQAGKEPASAALMAGQQFAGGKGDSEQDEKLEFIKNAAKDDKDYHPYVPTAARSANELKKGSFIPMVLERGISSDLPGQVTARVSENIYDTVTGCRLLLPAMTTAVGKYDSKVAVGQSRNLVVWTSLIFPDGQELNLAGMQGYDTSGAAGLEADVDNHYFRLFGLAFGMSMLTAEVQMSVPQPTNGSTTMTPQQALSIALTQQYGQLGAQILGKYMAVQPTLRNKVGERFLIMIPATVRMRKIWRQRC
ncbi:MAG: TrbI/VirB10 family protein [Pseudomonadota bacterium]